MVCHHSRMSTPARLLTLAFATVAAATLTAQGARVPTTANLQTMTARFAPTEISADLSKLSATDRQVLAKLVEASKIIDALFLRQVWAGNEAMLLDLVARRSRREGRARLHYFLINKGPWSRLDHNAPFVPGAPAEAGRAPTSIRTARRRPSSSGGSQSLPEAERAAATGFFTVDPPRAGGSVHRRALQRRIPGRAGARRGAAARGGAARPTEPTLKTFLTKRADAFLSNDYYDSDVAWMELNGAIEPTIGPYEVYEDELFNYKAGVRVVHHRAGRGGDREAAEVRRRAAGHREPPADRSEVPQPEARRARADRRRQRDLRGRRRQPRRADRRLQPAERRARHAREGHQARDAEERAGREVREDAACRSRRSCCRRPIRRTLSFDAFFTHIVVHELMHGLGPHNITVNGRQTTVRQELKETYSALEEAKADISGLFAHPVPDRQGRRCRSRSSRRCTRRILASAFRSIRFGVNEAHGKGIAIQLNYLLDQRRLRGAARRHVRGGHREDQGRASPALTREIMTIQAEGNYAKAQGARRSARRRAPGRCRRRSTS